MRRRGWAPRCHRLQTRCCRWCGGGGSAPAPPLSRPVSQPCFSSCPSHRVRVSTSPPRILGDRSSPPAKVPSPIKHGLGGSRQLLCPPGGQSAQAPNVHRLSMSDSLLARRRTADASLCDRVRSLLGDADAATSCSRKRQYENQACLLPTRRGPWPSFMLAPGTTVTDTMYVDVI